MRLFAKITRSPADRERLLTRIAAAAGGAGRADDAGVAGGLLPTSSMLKGGRRRLDTGESVTNHSTKNSGA